MGTCEHDLRPICNPKGQLFYYHCPKCGGTWDASRLDDPSVPIPHVGSVEDHNGGLRVVELSFSGFREEGD
jgi:hypothetical protein